MTVSLRTRSGEPASGVSFEQRRVALQIQRPAGLVVDPVSHGLPSSRARAARSCWPTTVIDRDVVAFEQGRPSFTALQKYGSGWAMPPPST